MKEFSIEELECIEFSALAQVEKVKHPLWKYALINLAGAANHLMFLKRNCEVHLDLPQYGQGKSSPSGESG
jgi:hypothetical protein